MATCAVCGADIEESTASPDEGYGSETYAPAQEEYRGDVYRFCCSDHKEEFREDPDAFVDG